MREVVALVLANHQKLALAVARTMQTMGAIKHENLEAGHAILFNQHGDFFNMLFVHRREVKAVVHMEFSLRSFQHLGVKLGIRPALVHVVLAGAKVVQAAGHAAHGRCPAFSDGVFFKRRINAAVHMRVHHAWKGQFARAVAHGFGQRYVDARRNAGELAVGNGDVGLMHHIAMRAHDAHVFNQQVIDRFVHGFTPSPL